jgi:hypothetical protein
MSLLALWLIALPALADSLPLPIPDTSRSLVEAMAEARRRTLRDFRAGRFDEAWRRPDSLQGLFPEERFLLLASEEEEIMAFVSRRWDKLLDPGRWNREFPFYLKGMLVPGKDRIRDSLALLLDYPARSLESELDRARIEPFQREFLRMLYLQQRGFRPVYGGSFTFPSAAESKRLNALAVEWLRLYPDKPYAKKVRNDFRQEYAPDWLGFGCDAGASLYLPMGGLGRDLERSPAFGLGLEVAVMRASLRAQLMRDGYTRLERDLVHRGASWEKGSGYELTYWDFQAGAEILRTESWRLIPFFLGGLAGLTNGDLRQSRLAAGGGGDPDESAWNPSTGFGIHLQRFFTQGWLAVPGYAGLAAGMRYPGLWRSFGGMSGGEVFFEFRLGYLSREWVREL